jgi:hypothetical protein
MNEFMDEVCKRVASNDLLIGDILDAVVYN